MEGLENSADKKVNVSDNAEDTRKDGSPVAEGTEGKEGGQQQEHREGDGQSDAGIGSARTEEGSGSEAKTEDRGLKNVQSTEENRRQRQLREQLEWARKYIGNNPYTKQPITTRQDLDAYYAMKKAADDGKDPLTEGWNYLAREENERIEKEAKQREQYEKDVRDFKSRYPDVDFNRLRSDPKFVEVADKYVGKLSMSEIYELHLQLNGVGKSGEGGESLAGEAAKKAKEKSSTGSISGSKPETPAYTMDQIRNMSVAEIRKNMDAVQASMDYWASK